MTRRGHDGDEARALDDLLEVIDALHAIGQGHDTGARLPSAPPPPSGRGRRRAPASPQQQPPLSVSDVLGSLAHIASLSGRRRGDDPSLQVLQDVVRDWLLAQTAAGREAAEYYQQASDDVRRLGGGLSLGRPRAASAPGAAGPGSAGRRGTTRGSSAASEPAEGSDRGRREGSEDDVGP